MHKVHTRYRYFIQLIVFILINHANGIDYGLYRNDTVPSLVSVSSKVPTLESLLEGQLSSPVNTPQLITEHLLQYGGLVRSQLLAKLGSQLYNSNEDLTITELTALNDIYQQTLERKYNLLSILPTSNSTLQEICANLKTPSLISSAKICQKITKRINLTFPPLSVEKIPPNLSIDAIFTQLKNNKLELTNNLFVGLLLHIPFNNYDAKTHNSLRHLIYSLINSNLNINNNNNNTNYSSITELIRSNLNAINSYELIPFAKYLSEQLNTELLPINSNIESLSAIFDNDKINLKYLLETILPNDTLDKDLIEAKTYLRHKLDGVKNWDINQLIGSEKYEYLRPDELLIALFDKLIDIDYLRDIASALKIDAHFWHKSHMIENLNDLLDLFDSYNNLRGINDYRELTRTIGRIKHYLVNSKNVTIELMCTRPRACLKEGLKMVRDCKGINEETKILINTFFEQSKDCSDCLRSDCKINDVTESQNGGELEMATTEKSGVTIGDCENSEDCEDNDVKSTLGYNYEKLKKIKKIKIKEHEEKENIEVTTESTQTTKSFRTLEEDKSERPILEILEKSKLEVTENPIVEMTESPIVLPKIESIPIESIKLDAPCTTPDCMEKPACTTPDCMEKLTCTTPDCMEKPACTTPDCMEKPACTTPDCMEKPACTTPDCMEKPACTTPDCMEKPACTTPDCMEKPACTTPDCMEKPACTTPDCMEKPACTTPDCMEKPSCTTPDCMEKPSCTTPDCMEKPACTTPDCMEKPACTTPDCMEKPACTTPDCMEKPACTTPDCMEKPACTTPDCMEKPACTTPDCMEKPACTTPDCTEKPACTTPDCMEKPACTTPDCMEKPACTTPDCMEKPACTTPDCTEKPACTTPDCMEKPACTTPDCMEKPACTTPDCMEKPACTTPDCMEKPACTTPDCLEKLTCTTPDCMEKPQISTKPIVEKPKTKIICHHRDPYHRKKIRKLNKIRNLSKVKLVSNSEPTEKINVTTNNNNNVNIVNSGYSVAMEEKNKLKINETVNKVKLNPILEKMVKKKSDIIHNAGSHLLGGKFGLRRENSARNLNSNVNVNSNSNKNSEQLKTRIFDSDESMSKNSDSSDSSSNSDSNLNENEREHSNYYKNLKKKKSKKYSKKYKKSNNMRKKSHKKMSYYNEEIKEEKKNYKNRESIESIRKNKSKKSRNHEEKKLRSRNENVNNNDNELRENSTRANGTLAANRMLDVDMTKFFNFEVKRDEKVKVKSRRDKRDVNVRINEKKSDDENENTNLVRRASEKSGISSKNESDLNKKNSTESGRRYMDLSMPKFFNFEIKRDETVTKTKKTKRSIPKFIRNSTDYDQVNNRMFDITAPKFFNVEFKRDETITEE
ncbi:uncharacterized protein LOC130674875 [Microplitis mediator]|uniref:uncharacterized protein LOC130674875 n=1 Tax=Microplitis mediator TaxID=375433 RepID=UPI0025577AC6|nr:uncharacterized protein LOC130674875 [Microplitis mediator]